MGGLEIDCLPNVHVPSRRSSSTSDPEKGVPPIYSAIPTRLHDPDFPIVYRTTQLIHARLALQNAFRSLHTTGPHVISSSGAPTHGRFPVCGFRGDTCTSHLAQTFTRRKFIVCRITTTPLKTISTTIPTTHRCIGNTNALTTSTTTTISKTTLPNGQPPTSPPTILSTSIFLLHETTPRGPLPLPPRSNPLSNLLSPPATNLPLRRLPSLPLLHKLQLQLPLPLRRPLPTPPPANPATPRGGGCGLRLGILESVQVSSEPVFSVRACSTGEDVAEPVCPAEDAVEYFAEFDGGVVLSAVGFAWTWGVETRSACVSGI